MHIHDLASAFQKKADDELLHLAGEIDQLTPEARSALHGELSARQVTYRENINFTRSMASLTQVVE